MAISENFDFSKLSPADRLTLISELWETVEEDALNTPLTAEQKEEIDRRVAAYKAGEMESSSWDDVQKRWDKL